jgi:cyanophycinase
VPTEIRPDGIEGSLVICGGNEMPDAVYARFRELAGGEQSRLVVIPTANERADTAEPVFWTAFWTGRGFSSVTVLNTRSRETAESPEFAAPLASATAVWINGGCQSRFADVYVGTRVERELGALLKRGGVIGGTSAGAAIQSRLMIAGGNPDAQLRQGLDLLPGAVIDQHFKVRQRLPRLLNVVEQHPGYIGLGIDEGTALVCRGRSIEVVGRSTVTVCLGSPVNAEERGAGLPAALEAADTTTDVALGSSNSSPQPEVRHYEIKAGEVVDFNLLRQAALDRARSVPLLASVGSERPQESPPDTVELGIE